MRKSIIVIFLFSLISFYCRSEEVEFLIEDSPYYVRKDMVVEKGQVFTAEPGVVIEAAKDVSIIIKGKLDIRGYPKGGEVIFKSRGPHQNYHKGFWQGIVVDSNQENRLEYAIIQHSKIGIELKEGSSANLTNNIITQNKIGIKAKGTKTLSIFQNSFLGNFTDIELIESSANINGNFFQGSLASIKLIQAYPKIENNYFKQLHRYAIVSRNDKKLQLGKNFWGSTDKEKIEKLISKEGKGKVAFEPFLKQPPGLKKENGGNSCTSCQ